MYLASPVYKLAFKGEFPKRLGFYQLVLGVGLSVSGKDFLLIGRGF